MPSLVCKNLSILGRLRWNHDITQSLTHYYKKEHLSKLLLSSNGELNTGEIHRFSPLGSPAKIK